MTRHKASKPGKRDRTVVLKKTLPERLPAHALWHGEVEAFLAALPRRRVFDLVITSPPYNTGKPYETKVELTQYLLWQGAIIAAIVPRLKPGGSICWQVGNYVENGYIRPLDVLLHPIFESHDLLLRNRVVWRFGHGLHAKKRFSGRYEVILWYTRDEDYTFNLDAVRIPSKYPGKKHYKGPKAGKISGNPDGKNPEDVWDIPNVVARHREKASHPCQFPVGLVERLVLALSKPRGLVFDPFCGVGSAGVAAAAHGRRFWGCEISAEYVRQAKARIDPAIEGKAEYRRHDKQVYDHKDSPLSLRPIGHVLRALRDEAGLTQAQLAKASHLSQVTISKYESGCMPIRSDKVPALAKALAVPPFRLFMTDAEWRRWERNA